MDVLTSIRAQKGSLSYFFLRSHIWLAELLTIPRIIVAKAHFRNGGVKLKKRDASVSSPETISKTLMIRTRLPAIPGPSSLLLTAAPHMKQTVSSLVRVALQSRHLSIFQPQCTHIGQKMDIQHKPYTDSYILRHALRGVLAALGGVGDRFGHPGRSAADCGADYRADFLYRVKRVAFLGVTIFIVPVIGTTGWLYYGLMESSELQATVGKRVLGLRVVRTDGQPVSFGRASARFFAKILSSILLVGFLMAAFRRTSRRCMTGSRGVW